MQLSPQEINEEKARVRGRRYRKYLLRLRLGHVRGFRDQELDFHFPVTALIGTNGGGKSTILGAAALAYKNTTPRTFFPKASIGDDSMADWRFEAEILDRDRNNDAPLQRTARFSQLKWRRDDFPERELLYIEIQRTVPAGEVSRFKRFLRDNPEEIELIDISEELPIHELQVGVA
jgi:predicted ATP-dependent endonuclease of OLD family